MGHEQRGRRAAHRGAKVWGLLFACGRLRNLTNCISLLVRFGIAVEPVRYNVL